MPYITTFVLCVLAWGWSVLGAFAFVMNKATTHITSKTDNDEPFDRDSVELVSFAVFVTLAILSALFFLWIGHSIFLWLDAAAAEARREMVRATILCAVRGCGE